MDLQNLLCKQDMCITDEPSACITRCPLHVDVKGMLQEASEGNFSKAYKILIKKLPFPKLLCRICDHVCEDACLRRDIGGCVSIQQLEKAIVKYGATVPGRSFPIPKNGSKIAVVGGGLSGLIAAVDLDKKGYKVTIYEKENKLGGRLWSFPDETLPKDILKEEVEAVGKGDIKIEFNTEMTYEDMVSLNEKYDALYIGIGKKIDLKVNSDTFETDIPGIFAGGLAADNESIIFSVSSGRRAAISIDRYVQKKSMTAVRENEGSYASSLKLDISEIVPIKQVKPLEDDGLSEREAIEEASRCIKCQCIECSKVCSHLRKYKTIPKQYIKKIYNNENVIMGDRYANKMINSCAMCGLCGEVCPTNLNMRDIILDTRKSMVSRDKMPPSAHDFALKDMEFSTSERFTMLKHQVGFDKSRYLFFPGCQLSASSPEYVEKIYDYLTESISEGVGIMLGCCGAPAEWAGREELFKRSIGKLKEAWDSMGKPTFILACSTCCSIFKGYAPEIEFVSLWDIISKLGLPKDSKVNEKRVFTVHDACTTRYDNSLQDSVRKIIEDLGHEIEELKFSKEKTKCCGYGGLVYYANNEQAEDFIKERIQESSRDYVVYCAMCKELFASQGKRTLHLLDLIYGEDLDKLSEKRGPRLWERRINRSSLKAKLLKKWGEDQISTGNVNSRLNIVLSEKIKDLMEKRWILLQDIEQVIENAEATEDKFVNPENGHYLAKKVLVNVTCWVEYEKTEESYIVHNAYSHRMEVLEDKNED